MKLTTGLALVCVFMNTACTRYYEPSVAAEYPPEPAPFADESVPAPHAPLDLTIAPPPPVIVSNLPRPPLLSSNQSHIPEYPGVQNPTIQLAILYIGNKIYESQAYRPYDPKMTVDENNAANAGQMHAAQPMINIVNEYRDSLVLYNAGHLTLETLSQQTLDILNAFKKADPNGQIISKIIHENPDYPGRLQEAVKAAKKVVAAPSASQTPALTFQ